MQAVCFDVDCTCTVNDSLDLLAEFMGVGSSVASITNSAMDGTMALEDALEERLRILNCTPEVLYPPRATLRCPRSEQGSGFRAQGRSRCSAASNGSAIQSPGSPKPRRR